MRQLEVGFGFLLGGVIGREHVFVFLNLAIFEELDALAVGALRAHGRSVSLIGLGNDAHHIWIAFELGRELRSVGQLRRHAAERLDRDVPRAADVVQRAVRCILLRDKVARLVPL